MGPNDSLVGRMFLCWLLCKLHPMLSKACAEFCDCQSSGICEELHEVSTSTGPVNTLQPLFFQGSMGECPGPIFNASGKIKGPGFRIRKSRNCHRTLMKK